MFGFVFTASWFEEKRSTLFLRKGPEKEVTGAAKAAPAVVNATRLARAGEGKNIGHLSSNCHLNGGKV
jgi:hypothetical protein